MPRTFAYSSTSTPRSAPASGMRARSGYSRSRAIIERRTPVLRVAPARNGETPRGHVASLEHVDAFDPVPEHLPARTRAVLPCTRCAHGVSTRCPVCSGRGLVATWIEIQIERRRRVQVSGDGEALRRHAAVDDPDDFERTATWPNRLLHQAWFRGVPAQLSPELRPTLRDNERVLWFVVQTFVG